MLICPLPSMQNIVFSKLNLYQDIIFCMEDGGHLLIPLDKWVNPSGGSKGPPHFEFSFRKFKVGVVMDHLITSSQSLVDDIDNNMIAKLYHY